MKVLFVTPSYFPIVGGSEVLTRNLAAKLNEIGVKADIMTFNMNEKWCPVWKTKIAKDGPITVFKVAAFNPLLNLPNPLSSLLRINVIPSTTFIGKLRDYDVIHFVGEVDLSLPFFSCFVRKPKILHCAAIYEHGGIYKYYTFYRPYFKNIFKKLFSNFATRYFVLEDKAKKLVSQLGVHPDKIMILPNAVDSKFFHPDQTKKTENLILFVGRLYRIKGVHLLLSALSHIKVPTHVVIIGPSWNEKYVQEIEQVSSKINEKGIHTVTLLGTVNDKHQLVTWYQKAAILVTPFYYESSSTVTLEALACGTPVVTTGTHISDESPDGLLVTNKDPKQLAETISKLLENKDLREKAGRDGRALIEKCFSWKVTIKRLVETYRDLLDNE
jgi:glycosyltransferase involved in cell wall biosynthesis